MTDPTNDSIYLEPGSVWRRGKEWRKVRELLEAFVYWNEFNLSVELADPIDNWLTWAKHPDTVLVYSPSGNKMPPKPGYVRLRIPVVTLPDKTVFVGGDGESVKRLESDCIYEEQHWHGSYITTDVRLPIETEPDEVEEVTE